MMDLMKTLTEPSAHAILRNQKIIEKVPKPLKRARHSPFIPLEVQEPDKLPTQITGHSISVEGVRIKSRTQSVSNSVSTKEYHKESVVLSNESILARMQAAADRLGGGREVYNVIVAEAPIEVELSQTTGGTPICSPGRETAQMHYRMQAARLMSESSGGVIRINNGRASGGVVDMGSLAIAEPISGTDIASPDCVKGRVTLPHSLARIGSGEDNQESGPRSFDHTLQGGIQFAANVQSDVAV